MAAPPPEEPPPACLYQELQLPPFPGPAPQVLGGAESFAGLLGPPDWGPDSARCFQVPPTAARFRSRLGLCGGPPRYRPAPMLDPGRRGTGLFEPPPPGDEAETPPPPPPRPRINVGPGFQAAVPAAAAREGGRAPRERPRAQLAWRPWPGLARAGEARRVEALLDLACSSALPGGGTNRELALHCLARAGGSLTGALELLLLGTPAWPPGHPLATYRYTGSDAWTPQERRLFAKALARHGKDFARIQQAVPSKRLPQCVEFYYLHKRRLGRARRQAPPGPEAPPDAAPGSRFPCRLCGKTFLKVKSRNAHMKIHRQPGGWGGPPLPPPPPPAWPPAPVCAAGGAAGAGQLFA
ncbi:zinc finger protein 541-like [Apteryx mantelli]|uniref:Zinc finger protein 541-like n=1 Tax=Apteryx mantelli TaxID=2696672 RepID=A0ABM4G106_9AVES